MLVSRAVRCQSVDNSTGIALVMKKINKDELTNSNALVSLEFSNISKKPLRFLELSSSTTYFCLSLEAKREDGKVFRSSNTGKIDFTGDEKFNFIHITRNKPYKKVVNINDVIMNKYFILPVGFYKVKIIYENYFVDNCVRGTLESNALKFQVVK